MKKTLVALLLALCGWAAAREAAACTTFCLKDKEALLFGKNYDWSIGHGLLVVNKRGVAKTSTITSQGRPASWTSKYGSVTFNQYGRELPHGGMNEAGLVLELMWLDDTRYPDPDGRPAVDCLEWIQYQLDRSSRVEEVIREAGKVRISSQSKIHYLACDRTGACATLEFLNGKLVSHTGGELPVPVLTNNTYADSLRYLRKNEANPKATQGVGSLARFARVSNLLEGYRSGAGKSPVEYAFGVLDSAAQGSYTQWSIVYDLRQKRVHYRTRENRAVRWFDLASFDFSCGKPVKILDVHQGSGDVTRKFADYRHEANLDLVTRSFRGTEFLADVPAEEIAAVAAHPQSMTCRP